MLVDSHVSGSKGAEWKMATRPSFGEVCVPTVHRFGPYRFFFYSNENRATREPPHVHVRSGNGSAKFWLEPVSVHEASGYTPREVERIRRIVVGSRETLLRRWHEFFDHPAWYQTDRN